MLSITLAILFALSVSAQPGRVHIQDVRAITLHRGQYTTFRRTSPVPQLRCVGGCYQDLSVVQCENKGFDGHDAVWECKADLDNAYRFGRLSVSCEGYDYPEDPYITAGSCGLEYTLETTGARPARTETYVHTYSETDAVVIGFLLFLLIIFIAAMLSSPGTTTSSPYYGGSHVVYTSPPSSGFWTGWTLGRLSAPSYAVRTSVSSSGGGSRTASGFATTSRR